MRVTQTKKRACQRSLIVLLAILFGVAPGEAQISSYLVDTGPLRIRDQFFLGMGFLGFDPVSADVLEVGEWQIDVIETVTNDFARSEEVRDKLETRESRQLLTLEELRGIEPGPGDRGIFLLDGELYRTAIAVRRGFGKGIQLELVVPVLSFQGGMIDSLVEEFHDVFGFDQEGRLGLPKDAFAVYMRSGDRELFVSDAPGFTVGDIVLGAKFRLLKGSANRPGRLALEALAKLPTGDDEPLGTSGSSDFGAQLLGTRYFSKSCLHGSIGVLQLGSSDRLGVSSQTLVSGMVAYERALKSKMTWLAQMTLSESPFGDLELSDLDRTSIQLTLGLKRVVGREVLFFGVTENVGSFNNTPDIGFHVGVTRSFKKKAPDVTAAEG